jgi:hypothetical protein
MLVLFSKLFLVRITPLWRYHEKTLVFNGIFIFQFLLLSTCMSCWIKVLYMDVTKNFPLLCRYKWNSPAPCVNWIISRRGSKTFQDASLGPIRSRLNLRFGSEVSISFGIVSDSWCTMLYIERYCSRRVILPSHLFFQNLTWDPFLIEKDPYGKKGTYLSP